MPMGDGRGPLGKGPLTGRGAGFCAGFRTPGYTRTGAGRGAGFGGGVRGSGFGFGRMFWLAGALPCCAYLAYKMLDRNKTKDK